MSYEKKNVNELLKKHYPYYKNSSEESINKARNIVNKMCRDGKFSSAEKKSGKWLIDESDYVANAGIGFVKMKPASQLTEREKREKEKKLAIMAAEVKRKNAAISQKPYKSSVSSYGGYQSQLYTKCPFCSSANIQKRDLIISGGKSRTFGVGINSEGSMMVGVGASRTQLSKDAEYENEMGGGLGVSFISALAFFVFAAIGWVLGMPFGQDAIIYTSLFFGIIGAVAPIIIHMIMQHQLSRDDREKKWMCLSCGAKF